MLISSFIFSLIAMICSMACLVIMLAKNYFSSHVIQYQPVDTSKMMEGFAPEMGSMFDPFKEIGDPLTEAEQEALELRKKRIQK